MTTAAKAGLLQKKVWGGSVPLSITLSPAECRTYEDSSPYLVRQPGLLQTFNANPTQIQCPRLSYLPFLLPKIRAFFASSLISSEVHAHDGWFTFEDLPLKWHYPVGLLYDLFSGAEPIYPPDRQHGHQARRTEYGEEQKRNHGQETLPWKLVLHFADWPQDQLVKLDVEGKVLQDAFINGVKEVRTSIAREQADGTESRLNSGRLSTQWFSQGCHGIE